MQTHHRNWISVVLFFSLAAVPAPSFAGGRADVTVTPLGSGAIERGKTMQSFRIPTDIDGPMPQALVLVAAQPFAAVQPAAPLANAAPGEEEKQVNVPATLRMTVAGKDLPAWELYKFPSAYVISPATLRANPLYANGRVEINFDLETIAEGLNLTAFGMPDPLLLGDSLDGPITTYLEEAKDAELKSYFGAMANEMAGNKELARTTYHDLSNSKNTHLAQLARRGVRMLSYDQRPHKLSGNFREHYRWGLFLSQAGVFSPAFKEFNECRIIYPMHSHAQYRAGEMLDHISGDVFKVQDYMDRSASSAWERNPAQWSMLIVIVKGEGEARLSDSQLLDLKAAWILAKDMIRGATGGKVVPQAAVYELDSEKSFPLTTYPGNIVAPAEDIVAERGWFDGVCYVRPRQIGDTGPAVQTIGGDVGPNGAALSTLYVNATWEDFLQAWYEQFTWAARRGGMTVGIPMADDYADCGHHPVPDKGYAIRAALKYHWPPDVLPWVKMVPRPGASEFLRLWDTTSSITVGATSPVESQTDVVDLHRLSSHSENADGASARCWVFSPEKQQVGVWLEGIASVSVNGRNVIQPNIQSNEARNDALGTSRASILVLQAGWNEIRLQFPDFKNSLCRFSVRLCGIDDRPVTGLAYVNVEPEADLAPAYQPPEAGKYYAWNDVRRDWGESLPNLSIDDLRMISSVGSLTLSGQAGEHGYAMLGGAQAASGSSVRELSSEWKPGQDSDVTLNNVLDWDREDCMALRCSKDGKQHDLLFVKPEALMSYMTLLGESPEAEKIFGGKPVDERLLGYVVVPTKSSSRRLFVIDCLLGKDSNWPQEEEDLLSPIAREYISNPPRMGPAYRQDSDSQ